MRIAQGSPAADSGSEALGAACTCLLQSLPSKQGATAADAAGAAGAKGALSTLASGSLDGITGEAAAALKGTDGLLLSGAAWVAHRLGPVLHPPPGPAGAGGNRK